MKPGFGPVWLFSLLLTACANGSSAPEDSYVGWHCSGKKHSDNWRCEQKLMNNGRPVGSIEITDGKTEPVVSGAVISELTAAEGHGNGERSGNDDPALLLEQPKKKKWRDQLPDMDASPEADDFIDTPRAASPKKPAVREVRRPEPVLLKGSEFSGSKFKGSEFNGNKLNGSQLTTTGRDNKGNAGKGKQVSPASTTAMRENLAGYTVQLGAFKEDSQLAQFIAESKLEGSNLQAHVIRTGDGALRYVLTWGQFATRREAEQQWDLQGRSDIEIWIRSLKSLSDVRVTGQGEVGVLGQKTAG